MANATRRVLAGSGVDARQLDLIAYGGNGPVHAWAIAAELGMRPRAGAQGGAGVQRPRPAGVGLQGRPHPQPRQPAVPGRPGPPARPARRARRTRSPTSSTRPACRPSRSTRMRYVQMAYAGQNFDMSVPARSAPAGTGSDGGAAELMELAERFHDAAPGRPRLLVPPAGADRARRAHHRARPHRRSRRRWPSSAPTRPPTPARPAPAAVRCTSATGSSTPPSTTAAALGDRRHAAPARRWSRSRSPSSSCPRGATLTLGDAHQLRAGAGVAT